MKQSLLSLLALAGAMFVSASASAWDEPVRPTPPAAPAQFEGTFVTPEVGGQYYIYNVGAGLFLGGGQTWGTRGIVLADRVVSTTEDPVAINNVSNNTTANYVLPFELEESSVDGAVTIVALNNSKNTDGAKYFVGEDGAQAWIDGDEGRMQNYGAWFISEYEGGYMLQNDYATNNKYADEPRAFGVDGNNTADGWATTWTDLYITLPEGNGTRPQIVWQFVSADDYDQVAAYTDQYNEAKDSETYKAQLAAYQDALEAYNAKSELLNALQEAEEAGVNTDAAGAVYNNPNATLDEVNNAMATLRAAIAGANYDFTGASDDEPLDVTDQVLTNPAFDGNMDGWTITVGGQNLTYQGRTDGQVDASKNWVSITGFIEAWIPSPSTLGDGTISQTVYGLPAGKYMLECDAMATKQGDADPEGAVEGAYIFIEDSNGNETREPIKAPDTQPKHWSVVFVSTGAPGLTFGLKVENTTANWISADNFRLWYYGETTRTREQLQLDQAISDAEAIDLEDTRAAKTAKEDLTEALTAAKALQSSSDAEALTAATETLKAALDNLRASIGEYQAVGNFLDELEEMMAAANDNGWDSLSDDLYEWQETINDGYTEGTLESEQIAGFSDELHEKIVAFLNTPNAIQEGNDLTFLLVNPHFTTGTTGAPTGWTINSGSMTELRQSTHNIETWHKEFDISQTLPNMPAGIYEVTLQGFARHDGSDTDKTWLYGGITKAQLIDLNNDATQKRTEPIFSADLVDERPTMGDGNYDNTTASDDEGNILYQANGMTGAYYWFQEMNPNTNEPYYTNHVSVIMAQQGDLNIGLHCETTTDWVIFDNFQVKYMGVSTAVYAEEINKMLEQLNALVEESDLTVAAKALYEALPAKAQSAIDNDDTDACVAVLQELDDAMTYIKEGNKKFTTLQDVAATYEERMLETPHTDTTGYTDMVSKAANAKDYADEYADNDAIDAMLRQIQAGWAPYVLGDAGEVTEENPYDATDIIYNADYMLDGVNSTDGWTAANAAGTVGDCIEYYNTNFDISQDLLGLKAGYYLVEMDGFYRAGGFAAAATAQRDSIDARNAKMYVVVDGDSLFTEFHSIFDYAQEEEIFGENEVDVELLNKESGEAGTYYIPNMPNAAVAYITAEDENGEPVGAYNTKLLFQVAADGTDVTIGARKDIHIDSEWTIFGWWKLTYYGTTIPSEYVGVKGLDAKADNKAAAIFGIDGRQQSQLRQGINIVRMSDGSVRKVLVK